MITTSAELVISLYDNQNPVRYMRNRHSLTQHDLAQSLGYTDQVITNIESGLMQSLPQALAEKLDIPTSHYTLWVISERARHEKYFRNGLIRQDLTSLSARWLPFRKSISASFRGFCRRAVLQPSILRDFELHRQRNRHIISQALSECGVQSDSLSALGLPVGSGPVS